MRSRAEFTSLLDELREARAQVHAEQPTRTPRAQSSASTFEFSPGDGPSATPRSVFAAYEFFQKALLTRRTKSLRDEVLSDLRLGQPRTLADLNQLRRRYAFKNHPDRVRPSRRADAAERMSLANMLIDAEISRQKRSS